MNENGVNIEAPNDRLVLRDGQAAMFGYGSLLLQRSMEVTLGRPYEGPRVPCSLSGWRRSWDVIMPNQSFYEELQGVQFVPQNIIYLNVRSEPSTLVNGILYVLGPGELKAFDRREWIYDRLAITTALKGVDLEGGEAYVYVAKPEWRLQPGATREWAALRKSYLDIIEEGLITLGPDFRAQYERSTDSVPTHLVFADHKREGTHPVLADVRSA